MSGPFKTMSAMPKLRIYYYLCGDGEVSMLVTAKETARKNVHSFGACIHRRTEKAESISK